MSTSEENKTQNPGITKPLTDWECEILTSMPHDYPTTEEQLHRALHDQPNSSARVLIDIMAVLGANRAWGGENSGYMVAEICQLIEAAFVDNIAYYPSSRGEQETAFWRSIANRRGLKHDAKAELPAESGAYIDAGGEIVVFDYVHYTAWKTYSTWDTQNSTDKQLLLDAGPYTKLVPERIDGS